MKRTKVAFFAEILIEDFDGAARTMFQLINRIDHTQFEYFFIYGNGPDKFEDHLTYKVPTFKIPANEDYCLAIPHLTKSKLERALDHFTPDVIHIATPSLLGFYALNYARKRNIPVLTIYHTHFIAYIAYYLKHVTPLVRPTITWIKKIMTNFYNRCDIVYIPSLEITRQLIKIGIDAGKVTLWKRGIDTSLFNPNKRDCTYIEQITQNNKPNLLFVSRLVWEKNLQTLIDIYQYCENERLDYNLIIAGDGTAKSAAMAEMPNAFFLGKQDHQQLSKLYASADIFIFPSISETYGNVVIEAMASGLPCIIANGGGSASLVEHGKTGFRCNTNNPKEYMYFVQKILSTPSLHQELKEEGVKYVKSLDWNELASRYFDDVNRLANIRTEPKLAWAN